MTPGRCCGVESQQRSAPPSAMADDGIALPHMLEHRIELWALGIFAAGPIFKALICSDTRQFVV